MIVHDCEQRSDAWFLLRLGIPTASNFDKILTPGGKASTQAEAYMHTLLAEILTGQQGGMESNAWMQRGTELEPEGRGFYELTTGNDVHEVGFITLDDGSAGCSPDGLIGDPGMLEMKVPAPHTHVGYLLSGELPSGYKPQVQGQLWIAEREWCDFLSYSPLMPPVLIRVQRDEKFIKALASAMAKFTETMAAKREDLASRGILNKQESRHE